MRSHAVRHPKKRRRKKKVGVAAMMPLRCPPAPPRLKVVDLNPHLSCILCGGYFIDATTITECLHSFCRACIVRYLETSEYCPVCEVQVHKSKPLRSDKILQDVVYKLVPGLFHNEMKRRRELYASQPPEALKESRDAEDRGECLDQKFIYASDEIFSLSIEYGKEVENKGSAAPEEDNVPKRRFLRCPAAVTISHLKKFVKMKYGIPNSYEVELKYDKESLRDDYTLIDVAYIFLWQRRGPMQFFYKIIERPPKTPKSEHAFMEVGVGAESPAEESETKDKGEGSGTDARLERAPPSQPPTVARQQDKDAAVVLPPDKPPVVTPGPAVEQQQQQQPTSPCETQPRTSPAHNPLLSAEVGKDVATKEAPVVENSTKKEPPKSIPSFKFPPVCLMQLGGKGTTDHTGDVGGNRPAVMTVAPLTKPSTSLPTTTTITHGTYTGISIKKSPPNTLPPFKISSHLLAPKVPPLKLSPPRFSKLEHCLRELKKSSSSASSRKSKSSRGGSSDKLELKVAQLKSTASSVKCVAPLVITVPPEAKLDTRIKDHHHPEKKPEVVKSPSKTSAPPVPQPRAPTPPPPEKPDPKASPEPDDKMDLDSDLFEGPLVIAEPPDVPPKDDSDAEKPPGGREESSSSAGKPEDSEDEEIDVVDDCEADSGRGSDVSSRTEARSLCGFDDDLGSPDSVPKTPEAERTVVGPMPPNHQAFPDPKSPSTSPRINGAAPNKLGNDCGVLDLSTCGRKRCHDGDMPVHHRAKQVANPAVLDKTRQTSTPCISPNPTPFKVIAGPPELSHHINLYGGKPGKHHEQQHQTGRGNFKCRGNTLTVINPDPNGSRPKIVIRNLGPRPDRGHERFHHHHHHHHNHHQRM